MEDFSKEGQKKFYDNWFKDTERILKNSHEGDINLSKSILYRLDQLKSYIHQKEMYDEELKIFWDIKKRHLIRCIKEKGKYNGVVSLESQEMENTINKYETRLRKFSLSFVKDLEKIIHEDKELMRFITSIN